MKRILTLSLLMCSLLLTACNNSDIKVTGGADGPTSVIGSKHKTDTKHTYDAEKHFTESYIDERKLPILDIYIENPFVSEDRTLILEDSIENNIELMIYDYYHNLMSGSYQEAKDMIIDDSLLAATEAYENNFKDGIYYSQITINEIDLVDRDDIEEITNENKQAIIDLLNDLKMKEFAIVEVEITIKHNEKALSMVGQIGDGEIKRYFLLGKKDNDYKIIEVYWEGFMND